MNREEHIKTHKHLHKALDELMADMIQHTTMLPSQATVMDLAKWSNEQQLNPTAGEGDEE